jgi:predicted TIM-barrel fold metal-dependent hydrolase
LYDSRIFDVATRLIGAGHILLGSDYPLLRARRLLRQVGESALSEADREAVKGGNAARLLLL